MRLFQTLRFKLTILYLVFIVTPFIISAFALPYYIQGLLSSETQKLTSGTLNALSRNIETYLDDLDRLSTSPYLSDDVMTALKLKANHRYQTANAYTRLKTDRALTGTLPNYLINTRPDILSTIIIPNTGPAYLTSKDYRIGVKEDFAFQEEDWYKDALQANGKAVFTSAHTQNYLINSEAQQVFSVARLIKDPDTRQPLAVILADADKKILEKITKDITFNVSSTVVILDENQNVLYSNHELPGELQAGLASFKSKDVYESASYNGVSRNISSSNWKIVVFLSNDELKSKVQWIYIIAFLLSAGALLVTFGVFVYFSRWIVKPFKKMNHIMNKVKKGDMSERFLTRGRDEIAQLGISLNNMISRLDELINQEFRSKLAQQNAEFRALQSQIQPHFLYNTLNGFIGLNREGQTKKLETAILSLSTMMRYSLEDNQHTTIEREFQFLEKYCLLQQVRFQEKLTARIHFDEELSNVSLPKMLIQPLVENAIIHGIEPDDKNNSVSITAAAIQENGVRIVRIAVSDDGVGFDSRIPFNETQIGLVNVMARLQMNYPDSTFHIESRPGTGTTITIKIPLGVIEL
ncbi:cache domain-containing sensor histidine kinase [Cohnella herbarum]|uniref:Sensor histidine kinase n=1 Tax=Cohnella herbarum TaxID=2728023 RepID=A0A7Z2VQV4_9BACL|nr:sensor histidine kinase [Cohnella herbarum]QJD87422.1 sensor histidine kinase [Cohnella herbarum]